MVKHIKLYAKDFAARSAAILVGFILVVALREGWATLKSRSSWKSIVSNEGRFSILMPKNTRTKVVTGRMNDPRFQGVTFFEGDWNQSFYLVGYGDEFDDIVQSFSIDERLDAARDGALKNAGGQLLVELRISKSGYPGREITMSCNGTRHRVRIYLAGKRRYILGVSGPDSLGSTGMTRFYDSFVFTR